MVFFRCLLSKPKKSSTRQREERRREAYKDKSEITLSTEKPAKQVWGMLMTVDDDDVDSEGTPLRQTIRLDSHTHTNNSLSNITVEKRRHLQIGLCLSIRH